MMGKKKITQRRALENCDNDISDAVTVMLSFYNFKIGRITIEDNIKPLLKLGSSPASFIEVSLFMI